MFDKTIVNNRLEKSIPYEKTIVEKKAPTDESIRLLNEFHDKSKENILDRIIVENNKFNYKAIVYEETYTMQRFVIYSFNINNIEFKGKVRIKNENSNHTMIDSIIKDLNNEITKQILQSTMFENGKE